MSAQQVMFCTGYEATSATYICQKGDLWLLISEKQSDRQYSEQPEVFKNKATTKWEFIVNLSEPHLKIVLIILSIKTA